jgi:predicted ATPase
MALHFCCLISFLARDPQAILEYAEETQSLASEHSLGAWPILIGACAGWAQLIRGNVEAGLDALIGGVERVVSVGVSMFVPFFQCRLAEVHLDLGDFASAERWVTAGEKLVTRTGELCYAGELRRLRGELFWEFGNMSEAERAYQDGLQLARSHGSAAVALRVATTYAERLTSVREHDRARAVLEPVVDLLAVGPQTVDLHAAQRVLSAIAKSQLN